MDFRELTNVHHEGLIGGALTDQRIQYTGSGYDFSGKLGNCWYAATLVGAFDGHMGGRKQGEEKR